MTQANRNLSRRKTAKRKQSYYVQWDRTLFLSLFKFY
jgi:hypothetical protein